MLLLASLLAFTACLNCIEIKSRSTVNTKSKNPSFRMSSTLSFPTNSLRSSSSLQSGLFSWLTVQPCTSASLPVLYLVPMQSAHPVLVLQYNTTFPYSSKIPFFSPVLLLLHLMWASLVLVQSKQEVLILHNHTHTHTLTDTYKRTTAHLSEDSPCACGIKIA